MDIKTKITDALKQAMRDKDATRLLTLRLVNAAIKDREISLRGTDKESAGVSEDDVLAILGKMVKQRQESARAYEEGARLELAQNELDEIKIIEDFLPKKLSDDETISAIDDAISASGASSIRDMGKVMGVLKSKYMGRLDFGKVGPMVKDRLG